MKAPRLWVMIPTERDHPGRVVVLPSSPRGIEVVPRQIRAPTSVDRAAEPDLLGQLATHG